MYVWVWVCVSGLKLPAKKRKLRTIVAQLQLHPFDPQQIDLPSKCNLSSLSFQNRAPKPWKQFPHSNTPLPVWIHLSKLSKRKGHCQCGVCYWLFVVAVVVVVVLTIFISILSFCHVSGLCGACVLTSSSHYHHIPCMTNTELAERQYNQGRGRDFELFAHFIATQSSGSFYSLHFAIIKATVSLLKRSHSSSRGHREPHCARSTLTHAERKCLTKVRCQNSRLLSFIKKKRKKKKRKSDTLRQNSLLDLQTGSNSIRSGDTLGADLSLASKDGLMALALLEYLIVPNETHTSVGCMDAEATLSEMPGIIHWET